MPRPYKTIEQLFEEVKQIAIDHNLSIEDIADNTDIEHQLLRIFFNESTDVIGSLSRLFKFTKISLFSSHRIFETYKIYDSGKQLKITRVIEPKCSMYYDKATAKFYKFAYKYKTKERTETRSDILKSEIKQLTNSYLGKDIRKTYKETLSNK